MLIFGLALLVLATCSISSENDFVFNSADIVSELVLDERNNLIVLEAFKSSLNDKILEEIKRIGNVTLLSQLHWVSMGHPFLAEYVEQTNQTKHTRLIHWSTNSFYVYINMLSPLQRESIMEKIRLKYKIDVDRSQVTNILIRKIECKFEVQCEKGQTLDIAGKREDIREFGFRLYFPLVKKRLFDLDTQRKCLEKSFANMTLSELSMSCQVWFDASGQCTRKFVVSVENIEAMKNASVGKQTLVKKSDPVLEMFSRNNADILQLQQSINSMRLEQKISGKSY